MAPHPAHRRTVYTLAIVKAVAFGMAPERSAKKLCSTEPSAVNVQTFEHRAMVMSMIITMSLCALWGMPPGKAVACGSAPYFCACACDELISFTPHDRTTIALGSGRYQGARCRQRKLRNEKAL